MTKRGLRLVPVVATTWIVAAWTTIVPPAAAPIALVAWLAAFAALATPARGKARVVVVLALVAAGAAASHVALAQPARTATASLGVDDGRAIEVSALVTGKAERWASGTIAFDAIATAITIGAETTAVRTEIVVLVEPDEAPASLDLGADVTVRGTARMAEPGERAVLIVTASRGLEVRQSPSGVLAVAAELRRGLAASVAGLPEPGAGLVPGLAVGDTSIVGTELDTAMKASSLSHLTAVSGANCAIVVGLAFTAAALLGARRGVRVAVALTALAGFVVLVTPEPSVVRAAAMATIAMLGVILGRAAAGIAILSLAVVILLVADPWLATSLGFALSAAATASLLLFARPLAAGLSRRLPRALALALSVPLAAQLACGPILVLIAPVVPLYGVVANLLAGPAAPIATIVGLAACLATPLPWLQSGLAVLAWAPASWIAATAVTFAAMPGAQLPWLEGAAGLTLLGAVGAGVGVLIAVRGEGRLPRSLRVLSGALLAGVIGTAIGGAALATTAGRLTLPVDWSVLACDVGQGDAVLVRSAGQTALIDTGPDPAALDACLVRAGIERIDLLVLTHFDLDHVGGADAVRSRVGVVLHGPAASRADDAIVRALTASGARAVPAGAGLTGSLGDAVWRVLWPPAESPAFAHGNDASVVVEFSGDGVPHALFLGDLSASPQRALDASGALDPPYALVKVAHHGSADQDAALYESLHPAVALLTVGAGNSYGHPRDEILDVLATLGARIARTDESGFVALWTTRDGASLWRERDVVGAR